MASNEDVLKILVATDLHVGYAEKDPVRGEDSFIALEEILKIGQDNKVDFVLLGGDLFHENKPTRRCIVKVMDLFRRYSLGPNPVKFRIVSDQALNFPFPEWYKKANYEDPNYKVQMPVFSIHGNHDDPAGDGRLAALDVIATANLVNFFGKSDNIDDISIYPILFEKGSTQVAIYGLGNIRDERLYRTFQQKKVKFMKPVSEADKWFNIFVLHQNRVHHTQKSCIHEVMIDTMFDLVIWGHEHECRINPEPSSVAPFHIIQPGSSIATSLNEGESRRKHVGILEIKDDNWRITPVPITTVRPFIMRDIILAKDASEIDITNEKKVTQFLSDFVEGIIEEAKTTFNTDVLPLIRLRIDVTGGVRIHPARFGQLFVGKVANPKDILLFQKKKVSGTRRTRGDDEEEKIHDSLRDLDETTVGEIIRSLLTNKDKSLEFFPESEIGEALAEFVDKNTKSAFADTISKWLKETYSLVSQDETITPDSDRIREFIKQRTFLLNESYKAQKDEQRASQSQASQNDEMETDTKVNIKPEAAAVNEDDFVDENNDDGFMNDPPVSPGFDSSPVKKEKRSRRGSTKSEPSATPSKRNSRKRKLESTSPSPSPSSRPRKQRRTQSPELKAEPSTVISLSDSDEEPEPKRVNTRTLTKNRKWGGRK